MFATVGELGSYSSAGFAVLVYVVCLITFRNGLSVTLLKLRQISLMGGGRVESAESLAIHFRVVACITREEHLVK